jgi:hypothetical protein
LSSLARSHNATIGQTLTQSCHCHFCRRRYEDIAFKVVDKQWEMGHRRGFRSQFSHNILQLWFHFRRERYRR